MAPAIDAMRRYKDSRRVMGLPHDLTLIARKGNRDGAHHEQVQSVGKSRGILCARLCR